MECAAAFGETLAMDQTPDSRPAAYFRHWRKHRGMTQEELAAAVGTTASSISQLENGKQGFTDSTLYAIAAALHCSPGDLLARKPDAEEDGAVSVVPIMGYLGAGAEVLPDFEQVPPEGLGSIEVPFPLPEDMIALQVRGDSMLPVFRDGHVLIVYREQKKPLEAFFGYEAAVRTSDGRRFIKTIQRGQNGAVNLFSFNAALIENVRLEWIGEIFATLPPAALVRTARQGGIQGHLKLRA